MAEISTKQWLSHVGTKLILVFLLFSVAENVLLLYQLRKLKESASYQGQGSPPTLQAGEALTELQVMDLNGAPKKLEFSGKRLIFVYSASCPACNRTFDDWKAIEHHVGKERVLYLSSDAIFDARKFAKEKGIVEQNFVLVSALEIKKLKIYRIPQTIFVDNGEVKAIHVGILPPNLVEVFKTIN